uniref:HDC14579 n=1 Tax=Drosophila melanogaster TaxID=7227 RepID=Q6IJN5_DROME|nr:TPA_inf: HDC14579 [Drosophila melanogaster]
MWHNRLYVESTGAQCGEKFFFGGGGESAKSQVTNKLDLPVNGAFPFPFSDTKSQPHTYTYTFRGENLSQSL